MKNIILILFTLAFLVMSCNQANKNRNCADKVNVTSKFSNGRIKSIRITNCKDEKYEKAIKFFENGDTNMIATLYDSLYDGEMRKFYNNGKLDFRAFNTHGRVDSVWMEFDDAGQHRAMQYSTVYPWDFALIRLDTELRITRYDYLIKGGKIALSAIYSTGGRIDTTFGKYLVSIKTNKTQYYIGDTLVYAFIVATPPGDSIQFLASCNNDRADQPEVLHDIAIIHSKAMLVKKLIKNGGYSITYQIRIFHNKDFTRPRIENGVINLNITT